MIDIPFPNDHAFRLIDPDKFDSFRRKNDAFGKGIDAIFGIYVKDGDKTSELQALRFDSNIWTFSEAKKWVKEHDYKPILSEPASGESDNSENLQEAFAEFRTTLAGDIEKILQEKLANEKSIKHTSNMNVQKMKTKVCDAGEEFAFNYVGENDFLPGDDTYTLRGVEIFAAGEWNGDTYTIADIDDMVANFATLKEELSPPLKLGHSESQDLLSKEGLPAAGWVINVWREGAKMLADFENIPAKIAALIRRKAYKKISVEIYWNYKSDVTGKKYRRVLRAVALLGEEIPAVSTIGDIEGLYSMGAKEYAEAQSVDADELHVVKFFVKKIDGADGKSVIEVDKTKNANQEGGETEVELKELEAKFEELKKNSEAKDAAHKANVEAREKENETLKGLVSKLQESTEATKKALDEQQKLNQATEKKLTEAQEKARIKDIEIFVEGVSSDSNMRVLPKDKALVTAILAACSDERIVKYREGEADKESTLATAFMAFVSNLPKQALGEGSKSGKGEKDVKDADKPRVYVDKVKGETFETDATEDKMHERALVIAREKKIDYAEALVEAYKES